jgi:hypothetical protein
LPAGQLPPNNSLDDVVVRIKQTYSNPNVKSITQCVLREGPRAFKIATLMEVINPTTGAFHHYSLKLDHIDRSKAGWFAKPAKSARLEGNEPDEIEKLFIFLSAVYGQKLSGHAGELHLIRGEDYKQLEGLLKSLPNLANTDKLQLAKTLLAQLSDADSTVAEFAAAFESSGRHVLRNIATASRLIGYKAAVAQLKSLVDSSDTTEQDLQRHLNAHPWMFGSEYSELLTRRTWTRDDRLDYMLRRTADNYLEIVEIKTPIPDALFVYDKSHGSYYPSSKLSPVIGQITRYIEEVERNRDSILAKDSVDTLKIRARAIIGRDHSPEEQAALRNLNAHLHRIEILTFDQLIRVAERVLAIFESDADTGADEQRLESDSDIPF